MKTPEEMAEEYAFKFYLNEDSGYAMTMNRDAFLAGYQAAKDTYKDAISAYEEVAKQMMEEAVRIMSPKDQFADASKVMNFPEKQDSCEHILDMEKMVDVNHSSGWISVKERLPEMGQRVLIYNPLEYVSIVMADYYNVTRPFFDHITLDDIHLTIYPDDDKQLYWMPLPEPPKEK